MRLFKGPLLGLRQFLTIENSLKVMKNAFYFILKALFILEILSFLAWLFGFVEKWLDKKAMVNFKFMAPYTGQQIITIHLIPNISRSKGNETWLVNKIQRENINFLQKPCRKWVGETSFRPLFVFQKSFIWGKCKLSAP